MRKGIIEDLDFERRIGFIRESGNEGSGIRRFFGFNESYPADIKRITVGDEVVYRLAPDRDPEKPDKAVSVRAAGSPDLLWDWAYFPSRAENLQELAGLALPEPWFFGHNPDPERPTPILFNYLQYTFLRVQLEKKLCFSEEGNLAAFNTGLVTRLYQPIIAAFRKNMSHARQPFILEGFCAPGEGGLGKDIIRNIPGELLPPEYVSDISDLVYLSPERAPDVDWRHVIIDGIRDGRFPHSFARDVCRDSCRSALADIDASECAEYSKNLADYMEAEGDGKTMRLMQSRINEALDLALKRVRWNFRTAVPMWYPSRRTMHLLLPLVLTEGDTVDLALVVEQIRHSGQKSKYIGHTVLPLDWAYMNARLISRPDSDWLQAQRITPRNDTAD